MTNGITMTNAIIESIVSRSTTKYYDPAVTLSDDQIRELVRIATTAPTSFHMQNWRFIAVRTPEAKARLRPIAWDQPPVTDAAVTFIVCGQLADSSVIPKRLAPVVEAGIMPAKLVPYWENPARGLYFEHPQRQRDDAVHTGAIGATAKQWPASSHWPRTKCRSCCCPWGRSFPGTGRRSHAVRSPMCWIWYSISEISNLQRLRCPELHCQSRNRCRPIRSRLSICSPRTSGSPQI